MMHASTSPLYTIIASNDVTSAMMDGRGGLTLTNEAIEEAVAFRQAMGRINAQFRKKKDWFFETWNATEVTVPGSRRARAVPRSAAGRVDDRSECVGHASGRRLARLRYVAGRLLHARSGQGVDRHARRRIKTATLGKTGIPATLVTAYLDRIGIQVEKTTDFTVLVLFSFGITKGKWGTLVTALLDFKKRLRREHAARADHSAVDEGEPGTLWRDGTARSRERDVRSAEVREADAVAREGVLDVAASRDDTGGCVPGTRARQHRTRAAREARKPRARDERRAVSARHSDADARREHRSRRRSVLCVSARAAAVGCALPGIWSRHARRREPRRQAVHAVSEEGCARRRRRRANAGGRR